MIQRIQTIFLLIAAIAFGLLFLWPFALSERADNHLFADKLYAINDHILLLALTILGILVSVIAIFLYKQRRSQVKLTYLMIIFSILIPVLALVFFLNESGPSAVKPEEIQDQAGMYLPIVSLIFSFLAMRNIQKDDKLVRSMDRLR